MQTVEMQQVEQTSSMASNHQCRPTHTHGEASHKVKASTYLDIDAGEHHLEPPSLMMGPDAVAGSSQQIRKI